MKIADFNKNSENPMQLEKNGLRKIEKFENPYLDKVLTKHEEYYILGYKKINEKYQVFNSKDLFDIWLYLNFHKLKFVQKYRMKLLLDLDKMDHSNYTQFKALALGLDEG